MVWHGDVWLIDHGASLYFHHSWAGAERQIAKPYDASDHVPATFVDDAAPGASSHRRSPPRCSAS